MSSAKRPLEDPSSPSAPTDLPEAKRPALNKAAQEEPASQTLDSATPSALPSAVATTLPLPPTTNGAAEAHSDVPSTSTAHTSVQPLVPDTHPILSTASETERASSESHSLPPQDETNWIHIRAVISSAEAATCIGKGGENVTQIRKLSGAKCTVSDYSRGAVERILTVSGAQDAVAKVRFCAGFPLNMARLT